jgi:hypothetical protein
MPLHKDFIKRSVKEAVKTHNVSVPPEELEKVLSSAIYNILNSSDFKRYVKELLK